MAIVTIINPHNQIHQRMYKYKPIKSFINNQIMHRPMSNRKEAIQAKMDEKSKVDFAELKIEDDRSFEKMIRVQQDKLYDVNKSIKKFVETPALILGDEFVNLVRQKRDIQNEIDFLKSVQEEYA